MKHSARFLLLLTAVVICRADDASSQSALLNKYCVGCHNDKLKSGGLSLQSADLSAVPAHAETWEKVIRKLRTGSMPPQGVPHPDAASIDSFASFLEGQVF